ncbi:sugar ABC transporter substrate-binding protein [Microbacterium indicum]|uniref:sugar ABC transporter substrate-binding protein n=1 Tax=Microbacterium indicum TaxID=358100 RepID=UPI00041F4F5F|nr:extracellular solute-binding protein [Microbacterium indicum]
MPLTTFSRRDLLRFSAVGLGTVGLLALSGCATGGTAASGDAAAPATDSTPTDFDFASWSLSEEAAKPSLEAALKAYGSDNGVTATGVTYPYNDYLKQLTLQVRGGQFTGAAHVDLAWLSAFAALGKLRDLGSYAEGRGYTDSALKASQLDGVQYALPWNIGAIGLIANADLFDKAGASMEPQTIEEFEEGLRALKGIGVIPYAASTDVAQLKDIMMWIQTFGGTVVEDDTVTLGDEASVKAVEWYKKLYDEGLISPDVDRFAARNLFAQETAALYDDAPVGVSAVVDAASDPNIVDKMTPMTRPTVKAGDTPVSVFWGGAICVVEGEGEGTAADFAQWITSDPDQVASYFADRGLPPATEAGLASEEVAADPFNVAFAEKITATATSNPLWGYVNYGQMDSAIAEAVQSVLIGKASATDALATAKGTIEGLIS